MTSQDNDQTVSSVVRRHWSLPHIAGVAFAILAYLAIYSVTGDSDLFIALATGAAGGALAWVALEIEFWFRNRTRT